MSGFRAWAHGLACVVWLVSSCGRDALGGAAQCESLAPGDVVITELHANPDGADGDSEYVELFNASGADMALEGLSLAVSRIDGASLKTHRFVDGIIADEAYFVAGNVAPPALPAHVDYGYEGSLGSLRNTDGVVSIWCRQTLIDEVRYETTTDGRALELDGALAPDHELNDEAHHWCSTPVGAAPSFEGNFGTPGAPNNPCERVGLGDGLCLQNGSSREVRAPAEGRVAITEWMANPAGDDSALEWVEVRFDEEADLNAFELGSSADALEAVVDDEDCVPVGAGAHVVFGASSAAAPRVDAALRFSLGNSGSKSIFAGSEGIVLDRVEYDGTSSGVSWQVDFDGALCLADSSDEYAPGNVGTPGQPNPSCPVVLEPGSCLDEGGVRDIVPPAVGEAHITEWMANPSAVDNRDGEWVELRFDAGVDLNGLTLSDLTAAETRLASQSCLSVEAGAHVVLARTVDPATNGGVDSVLAALSLSLNNADETLTLSIGNTVLDTVSWARSKAGVAMQIDELGQVCEAANSYGDGDLGTPGFANPVCV